MAERIDRLTKATISVLEYLLKDPDANHYGREILSETGLRSGTLYPLLGRLEELGWLTSSWVDNEVENRPRRRYYRFTPDGKTLASEAVASRTSTHGSSGRREGVEKKAGVDRHCEAKPWIPLSGDVLPQRLRSN